MTQISGFLADPGKCILHGMNNLEVVRKRSHMELSEGQQNVSAAEKKTLSVLFRQYKYMV